MGRDTELRFLCARRHGVVGNSARGCQRVARRMVATMLSRVPHSQVRCVVAERHLVRILCSVVQELVLRDLVDEEEEEDADQDSLPEGVRDHVERLVIDPVQLLQALQVALLARRVGDSPQTQVVHMAK